MPQFLSGEGKTAKVVMQNPAGKAFDYEGVILMGTNLAEMSRVVFHLNALESKEVSFPVVMPSVAGTYPVYIGVFSGGKSIALYQAIEDVVIVPLGTSFRLKAATSLLAPDGNIYPVTNLKWMLGLAYPPHTSPMYETPIMLVDQTTTFKLPVLELGYNWHWWFALWFDFQIPGETQPRPWLYQWQGDSLFEDKAVYEFVIGQRLGVVFVKV